MRGRYSVCAADSTVAMNRSSGHRNRPDRLRCPPSVVFSGYRSGGKVAESEADPSPSFGAQVGNKWNFISSFPYAFMACTGTNLPKCTVFLYECMDFCKCQGIVFVVFQIRFLPSFVSTPKFYLISYTRGIFATLLWGVGFNSLKLFVRNVISRRTSKRRRANSCLASVCLCLNENDQWPILHIRECSAYCLCCLLLCGMQYHLLLFSS